MTEDKRMSPAEYDEGANEIRFACPCGAVNRIGRPDPFELLSLFQGSMSAVCGECGLDSELELERVVSDDQDQA